jgi:leader peptidase (prepilin peptidase) / N-methyltransferase
MPSLPAGFDPLVVLLGVAGAAWGVAADRIAARWPAHEDGSVRGVDWRTVVVVFFALLALAAVPIRFGDTPQRILFGAFFAACVLLMATDLDQRLMPDVVTLPLIVVGAAVLVWGGDSLINRSPAWTAVLGAIIIPGFLYLVSLPFGADALGAADVKFMVSVGLLTGLIRVAIAAFAGALIGGLVVFGLLLGRRVSLQSYVPFGPFLIIGAVWAVLIPASS